MLEWDVPVNYKAIVDGFNEIYHMAELHHVGPEWTKSAGTPPSTSSTTTTPCVRPAARQRDQLDEDWDHHRNAICHYVVFPNTVFNCNPDQIQVFKPMPIDVDRTRFLCWELMYPGDLTTPSTPSYRSRCRRTGSS